MHDGTSTTTANRKIEVKRASNDHPSANQKAYLTFPTDFYQFCLLFPSRPIGTLTGISKDKRGVRYIRSHLSYFVLYLVRDGYGAPFCLLARRIHTQPVANSITGHEKEKERGNSTMRESPREAAEEEHSVEKRAGLVPRGNTRSESW